MLRKSFYSCFACAFAVVLATSAFWSMATSAALAQGDEGARVWTDSSGKYKITATLEAQEGDKVKLRTDKGKLIAMPIAQLSAGDQKYLKALNGEAPEEEAEEVDEPEEEVVPEDEDDFFAIKGKTIQPENLNAKVYVGAFDKVKKKSTVKSARAWKVEPTRKASESSIGTGIASLVQYRVNAVHELLYSRDSTFYALFSVSSASNSDSGGDRLARCDVKNGTHVAGKLSFNALRLLDVSRGGKLALFLVKPKAKDFVYRSPFLAIADVGSFKENETIEPLAIFCPYYKPKKSSNMRDGFDDVETAFFVDGDHIFTKCRTAATLWNIKTCRAEYLVDCTDERLFVDPTHKYFVLANVDGLGFYDVLTGDPLGYVALPKDPEKGVLMAPTELAFSPDGKKLAATRSYYVNIVDLTSGKVDRTFHLASPMTGTSWATNSHLLVGNYCYDVASGIPLAIYYGLPEASDLRVAVGGCVWTICDGKTLRSLQLPHAEALAAVKGKKPADLFDVYPGMEVSVKCELNGLLSDNDAIEQVKKRLFIAGLKYAPNAETFVVVTARDTGQTTKVPAQEIVHEKFFENSLFTHEKVVNEEAFEIKIYEQTVSFHAGGKELSKDSFVTIGPERLKRDPNKTLEQQVRESNRPELEIFGSVDYPPYSSKSRGERAATSANVSSGGVRPIAP